jgi:hypothetical protein
MVSDVSERMRSCPRHFLRNPRQAFGDLSYTVGLLKGGVTWLAERHGRWSGPRRLDGVISRFDAEERIGTGSNEGER